MNKNNRNLRFFATFVALTSCLTSGFAAPSRIASQSDLGKMWKTGGLKEMASSSGQWPVVQDGN